MIENIVTTKLGNEADNPQRTLFSTPTPWESGGVNLIVYKNRVLQHISNDYTIVSDLQLEMNIALDTTDTISMVITKLMGDDTDLTSLDRVAKIIENKTQSSTIKAAYEETIHSNIVIHSDDVWSSTIPELPADAITAGVAFEYDKIELVEDITVGNEKGWYASTNGLITGRIVNWIPSRFGQQYIVRLYDNNDVEIVSSDAIQWKWDYQAGYLFIEYDHTYTTPFKIKGYQYLGSYGAGGSGSSYWQSPIPTFTSLPTAGNQEGDTRLVLDTNIIYRWNNMFSEWQPTAFGSERFKDPVSTFTSLPSTNNIDGDFRLVLDNNSIFRWNESNVEWEDIINSHNHNTTYYTKTEIDTALLNKSDDPHEHHTLYYTKNESDAMIRWRPSRATEAELPPYTENEDGDVILTRNNNTIWRFDFSAGPQGEWIPISSNSLTWRYPVDDVVDLPTVGNIVGNVHLVINEGIPYWWDGAQWNSFLSSNHDHDTRYYLKSEIDVMIRWKPPVTDFASLPAINNTDGDIIITLDNNNVYRWDGLEWILISDSPRWRDPVNLVIDLPTTGNIDGDVRIVKENRIIYQWNGTIWLDISNPAHTHDDRYYTESELLGGALDGRYYREDEIDDLFDTISGHDHDGVNSKNIDYNNLVNIPVFYWQNPVVEFADLPMVGNQLGEARIVLNDSTVYFWDGNSWEILNEGNFALINHDHDDRYYTETEINLLISNLQITINAQLALKADLVHDHDDRYYTETEIDAEFADRFDPVTGHDHNGSNSKRISYYDLTNVPPLSAHDHDDIYYRQIELQTSGDSEVHWDNITFKPDLANGHWQSPVQTVGDLPSTGNTLYDIRIVLDDSDIYEWDGAAWVYVGHWANQYVVYWQEPVDTYINLPTVGNANGDVRLVLDSNMLYRWKSSISKWVNVSLAKVNMQVYLNGLQLVENEEWIKIGERSFELLITVINGDKVTSIITGENYIRKDFITTASQTYFEIVNTYHREDYILTSPKTEFILSSTYVMGGQNLLIWLNGLIQIKDVDYFEKDTSTFEFYSAAQIDDKVTVIIMEHDGGTGEYIREDQDAILGQTVFTLNNFYIPGSDQLLFYLNGNLLKKNDDYTETSSSSVLLSTPCNPACIVTFIIFKYGEGGGTCICDGNIILGIPTDGTYLDGLLEFYESTKVNDAVDEINETLLDLAPIPPATLEGKELELTGLNLYSGYTSDNNINYETIAGDFHNYLTENNSFTLFTPNTTTFGDADKGDILLYINGVEEDQFNLYNAFVENDETGIQTAVNYGIKSNGARDDEGASGTNGAIRNSTSGFISIMSIEIYNNFRKWQKGRVRINITPALLRQGYNYITVVHKIGLINKTTQEVKLFYDTSGTRPTLGPTVGCLEENLTTTKYLSGVRYYSIGDEFRGSFSAFQCFNNTFVLVPAKIDMSGLQQLDIEYNHSDITGVNSPPQISDSFDYNGVFGLDDYNEYDINAVIDISTFDPFGNGATRQSVSENRLVNTYISNVSTDLIESFLDEQYRLPNGTYDTLLASRTGNWTSSDPLVNGEALLYDKKLKYANINFSSHLPSQAINYSGFTGVQRYLRSFYKNIAKNSGTFIIRGMTATNLLNNQILIDIKLPTQTGWLSLNNNYDIVTFTGADGDGCLLNYDGEEFTYSSGTFSTANSGNTIIVRITLPNISTPELEYLELLW